jgi:hypothetical protein
MASYGIIERSFWKNPNIRALSHQAKLMLAYLFTCPHGNAAGCFVLPAAYVAADLKYSSEDVEQLFLELSAKPFIERDNETDLILILGWWGHHLIDNPNVLKNIISLIDELPRSPLKARSIDILKQSARGFVGVRRYVDKLLSEQSPNQEQEQEPEPEPEPITRARRANGHAILDGDVAEAFDLFWEEYPEKVGKPAARLKFPAALKRAGSIVVILDGLRRYKQRKPPDRAWLNPATFLHQDRWLDQPAAPARSSPRDVM